MKEKSTVPDIQGIVSDTPGFLALKPLRLCVFAVYELFRLYDLLFSVKVKKIEIHFFSCTKVERA